MVFECSFLCAGDFFLRSWEERQDLSVSSEKRGEVQDLSASLHSAPLLTRRGKVSVAYYRSWEERRSRTSPSVRKSSLPPLLKRRGKVSVAYYRSWEERRSRTSPPRCTRHLSSRGEASPLSGC